VKEVTGLRNLNNYVFVNEIKNGHMHKALITIFRTNSVQFVKTLRGEYLNKNHIVTIEFEE
jgi:hypothetical protein